jgi:hypothetical protein
MTSRHTLATVAPAAADASTTQVRRQEPDVTIG